MLAFLYCGDLVKNLNQLLNLTIPGGFYWSDGSEAELFTWDNNEPLDVNGTKGERCTVINSVTGRWFDTTCGLLLGYICKTKSGMVIVFSNNITNVSSCHVES